MDFLDKRVEDLRENADEKAWKSFYDELCGSKREQIEKLLLLLAQYLDREQRLWFVRKWMDKRKPLPLFKTKQAPSEHSDDGRSGAAAVAVSRADDVQSEVSPGDSAVRVTRAGDYWLLLGVRTPLECCVGGIAPPGFTEGSLRNS